MHVFAKLDASAVMVNDHTAFRVDWMPFAGQRQSGLGTGGIPYTMHDMTSDKMIVLRTDEMSEHLGPFLLVHEREGGERPLRIVDAYLEQARLQPVIGKKLRGLSSVAEGHRLLEERAVFGKVVIEIERKS